MQYAVVVNNRGIQLQTAEYRNWYRHDNWWYRGIAIYWDYFDTGIKTLVLTILIEVSPAISVQLTPEMCATAKNHKKHYNPCFGVQDHRFDTPKKLVTSACYVKQHVCNRFHAKRANSTKITTFRRYCSFTLISGQSPHPEATNFVTMMIALQFLDINILNHHHFHNDRSTFIESKNMWKK